MERMIGSAMTTQLRTTTWPGQAVPIPLVDVPDAVELEKDLLYFQISSPYGNWREIPAELYLRQARDLDVEDTAAVLDFVRTFGRVTPKHDLNSDLPVGAVADGITRFSHTRGRSYSREANPDFITPASPVHLDEVVFRLVHLQRLTEHAIAYRESDYVQRAWPGALTHGNGDEAEREAWRQFTAFANAALSAFHVRVWLDVDDPDFDIGNVDANVYQCAVLQLVNDLVDEVDLLRCHHCQRPFGRQVGRSVHQSRRKGVVYCSPACGRAASVKAYRARKRAEREKRQP
jgi:hypothetical protein